MPIYLKNGTDILTNLTNIFLDNQTKYYSTKTVREGGWYFEYTFLEGTGECVIGFEPKYDPCNCYLTITRETGLALYLNSTKFYNLDIDVTGVQYTAGIGFDIDSLTFYLRVDNETRIIDASKFITYNKTNEWNIVVRQRLLTGLHDIVDVNIGQSDFKYYVPFGLTSWGEKLKLNVITCKVERSMNYGRLVLISLVALK